MRNFTVFSVLALVATIKGDCQPECLEGCKRAILPSVGDKCTMLFGYGQDAGGWFQTDSDPAGLPTCLESCDKTCEYICNNGGIVWRVGFQMPLVDPSRQGKQATSQPGSSVGDSALAEP